MAKIIMPGAPIGSPGFPYCFEERNDSPPPRIHRAPFEHKPHYRCPRCDVIGKGEFCWSCEDVVDEKFRFITQPALI